MIDLIKKYDSIIIFRHIRPDMDAIGSQLALKEIIKNNFNNKQIYCVGEKSYKLESFGAMDEIKDFGIYQKSLGIVLDTANSPRIADQNYMYCAKVIKFDHHPDEDLFGDLRIVDQTASSTSEMIFQFCKQNNLKINDEIAKLLYLGIVGDTGRFMHSNTKPNTLAIGAELLKYNFNPQKEIFELIYQKTLAQARFEGYVLTNLKVEDQIGYIVITKEIIKKYEVMPGDIGQFMFHFGEIPQIRAWVTFVEDKGFIRGSLRSKEIIINDLATKFSGGGHPLASGFRLESLDQVNDVIEALKKHVN